MATKICARCKTEKDFSQFWNVKTGSMGKSSYCKDCGKIINKESRNKNIEAIKAGNRAWYARTREKHSAYSLRKRYSVTNEQIETMRKMTHCPICGNKAIHETKGRGCKSGKIVVDHEHETNKVRGFICTYCNLILGNAKDNIATLKNAISYLEAHQTTGQ